MFVFKLLFFSCIILTHRHTYNMYIQCNLNLLWSNNICALSKQVCRALVVRSRFARVSTHAGAHASTHAATNGVVASPASNAVVFDVRTCVAGALENLAVWNLKTGQLVRCGADTHARRSSTDFATVVVLFAVVAVCCLFVVVFRRSAAKAARRGVARRDHGD